MCLNFWSLFIVTMMSHFRQKRSKPGNEDLFTTMGQGSAGEQVSSGWGGGGERTYRNRYLISDLIRCCQATNDEKPDLKSFPYCNLRENFMVDIWSQRLLFFFPLKILRYRAPLNPRRDGQATTTSQSLIDSDTHTYHEVVDKNWMNNFLMLAS